MYEYVALNDFCIRGWLTQPLYDEHPEAGSFSTECNYPIPKGKIIHLTDDLRLVERTTLGVSVHGSIFSSFESLPMRNLAAVHEGNRKTVYSYVKLVSERAELTDKFYNSVWMEENWEEFICDCNSIEETEKYLKKYTALQVASKSLKMQLDSLEMQIGSIEKKLRGNHYADNQ